VSLQPSSHSVTLKDGIDLDQLQRGEGTVFEVDPTAPLAGANQDEEGYNEEEVHQYLNYDCIDVEGADSDSEEVTDTAVVCASYTHHLTPQPYQQSCVFPSLRLCPHLSGWQQ